MISLVSNNQIINLLILLPYTFVLRLHSLMYPQLYIVTQDDSFFTNWIYSLLGENALVHSIVAALMVYAIAVIIGVLANKFRLFQRPNLYASYFFVLLASLISEVQMLSPVLLALLFFALYIRSCMMIYRYHLRDFEIFNMGLFAMMAGLLYSPFLMLLFASLFVVLFFEGVNIKSFLLLIMGMLATAIIIYSTFYFFDILATKEVETLGLSKIISDSSYWVFERVMYTAIILAFVIFGSSRYYSFLKKKIIDARKRITFLFLLTILMSITPIFFIGTDVHFLLILALLSSFFLAFFFDGRRNTILVEVIHFALLIVLFGFQFNIITV